MKKKGNKRMIIILGCVVGAVVIVAGVSKISGGKQAEVIPSVDTVSAETGDVSQEVDVSGTVVSEKTKTFYSPVNAKINKLGYKDGDTVKQGTQLVTYDLKDLETNNQKAELSLKSGQYDYEGAVKKSQEAVSKQNEAKDNVEVLEAQIENQEQYVKDLKAQLAQETINAQIDAQNQAIQAAEDAQSEMEQKREEAQEQYDAALKKYKNEELPKYEEELGKLQAEVNKCRSEFNAADTKYQMALTKWENCTDETQEKLLSQKVDEADTARTDAENNLKKAEEAYNDYKANAPVAPQPDTSYMTESAGSGVSETPIVDTSDLEAELEQASSDLAELQSELASEKAVAEADSAELSEEDKGKLRIATNLSELEAKTAEELVLEGKKGLQAEFTGVITSPTGVSVSEGATVTQGMELFTISSLDDVSVDVNISKYDYDKVKVGQKAKITLADNEYEGTVSRISHLAKTNEKGSTLISATVKIDNPDKNIFLGVDAKVTIQAGDAHNVVVVPSDVVNIGKDGSFCYVVQDGVIVKQDVKTGISSDTETEIVQGLKKGDDVVKDIGTLEEGDKAVSNDVSSEEAEE